MGLSTACVNDVGRPGLPEKLIAEPTAEFLDRQ